MTLPDAASLEGFSLAELREVVGRLVGEVRRLQSDNAALRTENQALRDEVARLKGLPPRPPLRPSGMEQATQPGAADKDAKRSKPPRGVKRDRDAITAERVCKATVPAGSRFKCQSASEGDPQSASKRDPLWWLGSAVPVGPAPWA